MRKLALAALIVFSCLTWTACDDNGTSGKNCDKGIPCGNTCISKDDVCHK
jgi:hypothetical protein